MKYATRIALFVIAVTLLAAITVAADEDRTCAACGRPVQDSYYETGGRFYHPGCFTCDHCRKPIKDSFTVFRKKNYHTPCFEEHVALRCAMCDGIIEGQYLLDYWGNAYHTRHKGTVLQCDFCQRFIVGPLADGMRRLPDGRTHCAKCARTSVTRVRDARSILLDAAKTLEKCGITVDPAPIELHLVGQQELRRIAGTRSRDTKGFTDYLVKKGPFGTAKNERTKVYLLDGMPRIQTVGTVAHELMHVWQFQRGRLEQDPVLCEGSCNFASYLVLRRIGGAEADYVIDSMLTDPDRVYGEGFRRVKAYAESEGIRAWLQLLEEKDPDLSKL